MSSLPGFKDSRTPGASVALVVSFTAPSCRIGGGTRLWNRSDWLIDSTHEKINVKIFLISPIELILPFCLQALPLFLTRQILRVSENDTSGLYIATWWCGVLFPLTQAQSVRASWCRLQSLPCVQLQISGYLCYQLLNGIRPAFTDTASGCLHCRELVFRPLINTEKKKKIDQFLPSGVHKLQVINFLLSVFAMRSR